MIKDKRLLGHINYTFPNSLGNKFQVYGLEYIIDSSKTSLQVSFGDSKKVLFQEKRENKEGVYVSNPRLAKERFEKMEREYIAGLIDLVDSNLNKILSFGIRKATNRWIL